MKQRFWLPCLYIILLTINLHTLSADDIQLGSFPQGQWLDTAWQAYWTFGDNTITLRDVKDKELYNFAGIVQNMKVTDLPNGGVRLTFDCAKARRSYLFERATAKDPMRMEIRQAGSSVAYKSKMPTVNEKQLTDYKAAVIAAKPAELAKVVAAIEEVKIDPSAAAAALAAKQAAELEQRRATVLEQAASGDFTALEQSIDAAVKAGQTEQLVQALEAAAAKADAPPSVFVALSVLYGRKGLKTQEYAALELAEKAPIPPGINFNVALVYGRKQLLAGAPDAKNFMVGDIELAVNPPEATITLDGNVLGSGSQTIAKLAAGKHYLKVDAEGYEGYEQAIELGVGQGQHIEAALVAKPCFLEFDIATKDAWVRVDGTDDLWDSPAPISPGEHRLEIMEFNHQSVFETISVKPGETIKRNWKLELAELPFMITSDPPGATVTIDGQVVGITPISDLPVLAGSHQVKFEKEGWPIVESKRDFWAYFASELLVTHQRLPFLVPTKTIKLDGKNDDWSDVTKAEFKPNSRDEAPKVPGSQVSDFRICQDKNYVYWYMEFADGKPTFSSGFSYSVLFHRDLFSTAKHTALKLGSGYDNGTWKPHIPSNVRNGGNDFSDLWNDSGSLMDFRVGANFIEARFSRTALLKDIKEGETVAIDIHTYRENPFGLYSGFTIPEIRLK